MKAVLDDMAPATWAVVDATDDHSRRAHASSMAFLEQRGLRTQRVDRVNLELRARAIELL